MAPPTASCSKSSGPAPLRSTCSAAGSKKEAMSLHHTAVSRSSMQCICISAQHPLSHQAIPDTAGSQHHSRIYKTSMLLTNTVRQKPGDFRTGLRNSC